MIAVRYGLPAVIVLAGMLALIFNRSITGLEGLAMGIGVAGSVLLLNVLYRVGVSGDRERDDEEAARVYFDEHGRWPDDRSAQLAGRGACGRWSSAGRRRETWTDRCSGSTSGYSVAKSRLASSNKAAIVSISGRSANQCSIM